MAIVEIVLPFEALLERGTYEKRMGPSGKAWQGWLDSNQRMRESKSLALPLGYTPVWKKNQGLGSLPIPDIQWGG